MQSDSENSQPSATLPCVDELGLSSSSDEEGLDRLTSLLANLGGAPMAAFWVMDGDRQFLASAHGNISRELPQHSEFGRRTLRENGLLIIEDARKDAQLASDPLVCSGPGIRYFAGITLRGRGDSPIGALCLMDTEVGKLSRAGKSALEALATLLEDRLRLRADVLHDPQTGALARRKFDQIADREWRRAMRAQVPVSVIISELDQLDVFARREGPAALDRGIRAAALATQYSLHRPSDCVGRYNRKRFVTLLYGTDAAGAANTAERIRLAVENLQIPFSEAPNQVLTLSQGIDSTTAENLSRGNIDQAVSAAMRALEAAQKAGGNRSLASAQVARL